MLKLNVSGKVTRQCPQITNFEWRERSRAGAEQKRGPALPLRHYFPSCLTAAPFLPVLLYRCAIPSRPALPLRHSFPPCFTAAPFLPVLLYRCAIPSRPALPLRHSFPPCFTAAPFLPALLYRCAIPSRPALPLRHSFPSCFTAAPFLPALLYRCAIPSRPALPLRHSFPPCFTAAPFESFPSCLTAAPFESFPSCFTSTQTVGTQGPNCSHSTCTFLKAVNLLYVYPVSICLLVLFMCGTHVFMVWLDWGARNGAIPPSEMPGPLHCVRTAGQTDNTWVVALCPDSGPNR